ncbi:hypothetical protein [Poseidonibacter lekithochrous]|uniref:hypothetical protein n=1 Tax=Poseidonibacter lekithochrous TaxID=1904463 RepID=UPI0008FCBCED|nr:hypothetical protein [Poseidonibacter lekithochrous]QKJ22432.1 hypothetical protein ALEK_1153 [Poseidonibacter lekithochrous]
MAENYYTQNKSEILSIVEEQGFMSTLDLDTLLKELKDKRLVSLSLSYDDFFSKLLDDELIMHSIKIRNVVKARYTLRKIFNIYDFTYSLESRSFFPMFTSLNIQGLSNFREKFVFVSKERSQRSDFKSKNIKQDAIDNAFSKKPRMTQARDRINGFNVVMLESNNTEEIEIIQYGKYKVSSVNRAFVEVISNIQYFKSPEDVIEQFRKIKDQLDIDKIFDVIKKFDFVYPYYQLAGFYLEKIGVNKDKLNIFYEMKSTLKFYTVKNKEIYSFDDHWNIYY